MQDPDITREKTH